MSTRRIMTRAGVVRANGTRIIFPFASTTGGTAHRSTCARFTGTRFIQIVQRWIMILFLSRRHDTFWVDVSLRSAIEKMTSKSSLRTWRDRLGHWGQNQNWAAQMIRRVCCLSNEVVLFITIEPSTLRCPHCEILHCDKDIHHGYFDVRRLAIISHR